MKDVTRQQRWQDRINLLLGIWMVLSSWIIGVTSRPVETNAVIVGLLVILFAVLAMAISRGGQRKDPLTP